MKSILAGRRVTCVMHYGTWDSARDAAVKGHRAEFDAFAETLSMQDIVDVANEVMRENSIPAPLSAKTIARLCEKDLSESRKKLAFIYATAFKRLREGDERV